MESVCAALGLPADAAPAEVAVHATRTRLRAANAEDALRALETARVSDIAERAALQQQLEDRLSAIASLERETALLREASVAAPSSEALSAELADTRRALERVRVEADVAREVATEMGRSLNGARDDAHRYRASALAAEAEAARLAGMIEGLRVEVSRYARETAGAHVEVDNVSQAFAAYRAERIAETTDLRTRLSAAEDSARTAEAELGSTRASLIERERAHRSAVAEKNDAEAVLSERERVFSAEISVMRTSVEAQRTALAEAARRISELEGMTGDADGGAQRALAEERQHSCDLAKQVQALLARIEGISLPGEEGALNTQVTAQDVVSARLVTFASVQELQVRNASLLRAVRRLGAVRDAPGASGRVEAGLRARLEAVGAELADAAASRARTDALLVELSAERDRLSARVISLEKRLEERMDERPVLPITAPATVPQPQSEKMSEAVLAALNATVQVVTARAEESARREAVANARAHAAEVSGEEVRAELREAQATALALRSERDTATSMLADVSAAASRREAALVEAAERANRFSDAASREADAARAELREAAATARASQAAVEREYRALVARLAMATASLDEQRSRVDDLRSQVSARDASIAELEAQSATLSARLSSVFDVASGAALAEGGSLDGTDVVAALEMRARSLQDELVASRSEALSAREHAEAAQNELNGLRQELNELSNRLAVLLPERDSLAEALRTSEQSLAVSGEALQRVSAEHSDAIESLARDHAATVRSLMEEHGSVVSSLRAEHEIVLDTLKKDHEAISGSIAAEMESERAVLRQRIDELTAQTSELEGLLTDNNDQMVTLKAAITSLTRERDDALKRATDAETASTALADEHCGNEAAVAFLRRRRDALQAELDALALDHKRALERVAAHETELAALRSVVSGRPSEESAAEIAALREDRARLDTAIDSLSTELSVVRDQLSTAVNDLAASKIALAKLQNAEGSETLAARYDALADKHRRLLEQSRQLVAQRAELAARCAAFEAEREAVPGNRDDGPQATGNAEEIARENAMLREQAYALGERLATYADAIRRLVALKNALASHLGDTLAAYPTAEPAQNTQSVHSPTAEEIAARTAETVARRSVLRSAVLPAEAQPRRAKPRQHMSD